VVVGEVDLSLMIRPETQQWREEIPGRFIGSKSGSLEMRLFFDGVEEEKKRVGGERLLKTEQTMAVFPLSFFGHQLMQVRPRLLSIIPLFLLIQHRF
jgi:hypothetical protein